MNETQNQSVDSGTHDRVIVELTTKNAALQTQNKALLIENNSVRAKLAIQGQCQMEELDNLKQEITFAIDAAVRKEEKAMQVTWNPVTWFTSGTAIKRWLALIEIQREVREIIRKSDGF